MQRTLPRRAATDSENKSKTEHKITKKTDNEGHVAESWTSWNRCNWRWYKLCFIIKLHRYCRQPSQTARNVLGLLVCLCACVCLCPSASGCNRKRKVQTKSSTKRAAVCRNRQNAYSTLCWHRGAIIGEYIAHVASVSCNANTERCSVGRSP